MGFHSHGGTPIAGGFIMGYPIEMGDLGVPPHLWKHPYIEILLVNDSIVDNVG